MRALLASAALLLVATCAVAQQPFWQRSVTPIAGRAWPIASDSTGALFALTADGIYRSIDNGNSWTRTAGTKRDASLVAFAATRGGELYAAAIDSGLYRSTDGGSSWMWMKGPADGDWIRDIAVASDAREILAATAGGIARSTDRGASWSETGWRRRSWRVVVDDDGSAIAVVDSGLVRSRDGHRSTWAWMLTEDRFGAVHTALRTRNGSLLAALASGGVARSSDDGATWLRFGTESTVGFSSLVHGNGAEILATMGTTILLRSTDDGMSWTPLDSMIGEIVGYHRDAGGRLFASSVRGVLASDEDGATWRSSDAGINSATIPAVVATRSALVALTDGGSVLRSIDDGVTWSAMPAVKTEDGASIRPITLLSADGAGVLFVASGSGDLLRSTDGGETWHAPRGWPVRPLTGLHALGGGRVVATYGERVYLSSDGGDSWSIHNPLPDGFTVLSVAEGDRALFAATPFGIYRSAEGSDWERVSLDPAYAIASGRGGVLFAALDEGVGRSSDDGATWTTVLVTDRSFVLRLASGPRGEVVAGMRHGGAHVSTDDGATWRAQSDGMTNSQIASLVPAPGGTVIAGTYGGGIYRSGRPLSGSASPMEADESAIVIRPHPASTRATLSITLPRRSHVRLDLLDALGRRVTTLYSGALDTGEQRLPIDASGLAAASYFVRAIADGRALHARLVVIR